MASFKKIPDRLLDYKLKHELTYQELGTLIGTTKAIAFDICKGRRKFLSLTVVEKIVNLLEA